MKYIIITIVIAAIIAVLSQVFGITNSKNDKYFLVLISVVLILSGVYFSYKSEKEKDTQTTEQGLKIDNTLVNTENLKKATVEIVDNLEVSMDNLKTITEDIDTLTGNLNNLKLDLNSQINTIKTTLKKTDEFQKIVSKQLELAEKQFKIDRPIVMAYVPGFVDDTMDENKVNISYYYKNKGNRTATNISENKIILFYNNEKNIFQHQNKIGESSEIPDYTANGGGSQFIFNNRIPKEYLGKEIEVLILILSISYDDVATGELHNETFTFYCNHLKRKDYKFNKATPSFIKMSKEYLIKNKIKDFYKS